MSVDAIHESYNEQNQHGLPIIQSLSQKELKKKQRSDSSIREVIHHFETGERVPPTANQELPELPFLLRELKHLELQNDILYKMRQEGIKCYIH